MTATAQRLSGPAGGLTHQTIGTQCLTGRVRQTSNRLTGCATRLHRLLCRLPNISERFADSPTGTERLLAELADASDGVVDGVDKALQDFRIPIKGCQRPIKDVVEVFKAHFEPRLGLHALDVDLDLAQADVDAGDDLEKVR